MQWDKLKQFYPVLFKTHYNEDNASIREGILSYFAKLEFKRSTSIRLKYIRLCLKNDVMSRF